MRQYEFSMIHKTTGRAEQKRATAATEQIARAQIVLMYGNHFTIGELPSEVNPPHQFAGEIDCSYFPMSDLPWLIWGAANVEGVNQ